MAHDADHYPTEVLELLIEGIPRLFKSKDAVLDFFRGAGVPTSALAPMQQRVRTDRSSISKNEIVRTVLVSLNEAGDALLRPRREIIKRLSEIEDYSSAWPADVVVAKAFIADLRRLVAAKDAVTRIETARNDERRERLAQRDQEAAQLASRRARYRDVRDRLFALFAVADPWQRGKALEAVLNELFAVHDVLVRNAFALRGDQQEGIVEQIDGAIVLDGDTYLVEMKWHSSAVGVDIVAQHWVRVAQRDGARGLFISASGFTEPAIKSARDGLAMKTFVLLPLQDLVQALNEERCVREFLRRRVAAAVIDKDPHRSVDVRALPPFS